MSRKSAEREYARVGRLVEDQVAQGRTSFQIAFNCMADGIANYKIFAMREASRRFIEDELGLVVLESEYDEWKYTVFYRVEVPEPTKKCPMCAELIKVEAIKCRYCGASV